MLDEIAPTQEGVHSNSVVDRWLSSASDADHSGYQVRFCLFFAQSGKEQHNGHFVNASVGLLADITDYFALESGIIIPSVFVISIQWSFR
ncbi:TPA: hypothetical protein NPO98_003638 [Klebsiella quasipneumoniae subsp. similipneumoniae]|nr:hypothetical protein [Klebsiella quasipneumoniae subsp. similipneumoniae]